MRRHTVELSNGELLIVEERIDRVEIAQGNDDGDVHVYLCRITSGGILVYPNSGSDPCWNICSGLVSFKEGDLVYWSDPDGGKCSKYGRIDKVDEDVVTLHDGTQCLVFELEYAP